jgi:hypothetical protein
MLPSSDLFMVDTLPLDVIECHQVMHLVHPVPNSDFLALYIFLLSCQYQASSCSILYCIMKKISIPNLNQHWVSIIKSVLLKMRKIFCHKNNKLSLWLSAQQSMLSNIQLCQMLQTFFAAQFTHLQVKLKCLTPANISTLVWHFLRMVVVSYSQHFIFSVTYEWAQ